MASEIHQLVLNIAIICCPTMPDIIRRLLIQAKLQTSLGSVLQRGFYQLGKEKILHPSRRGHPTSEVLTVTRKIKIPWVLKRVFAGWYGKGLISGSG